MQIFPPKFPKRSPNTTKKCVKCENPTPPTVFVRIKEYIPMMAGTTSSGWLHMFDSMSSA